MALTHLESPELYKTILNFGGEGFINNKPDLLM